MIPDRFLSSFCRLLLLFSLQSSAFSLQPSTLGAPINLGQNLAYLRLQGRPDDATVLATAWGKPALILDLRYHAANAKQSLPSDLPSRPREAPLFVLVGPATSPQVLEALRQRAPALITLGLPVPGLTPDIDLAVKPDEDRRAYEALDSGVPIESLFSEKLSKQRFDEAALVHERAQELGDTATAPPPAAKLPNAPAHPSAASPPTEPSDAVLQRAVQLHRTLLALGKLPRP